MTHDRGETGVGLRVCGYLGVVALLTFVGHEIGMALWDRAWESTDQSGDPELGSLYAVAGITCGLALGLVLVFAHIITPRNRLRHRRID